MKLKPVFIFSTPGSGPTRVAVWRPPAITEPATTATLAELIVAYRRWLRGKEAEFGERLDLVGSVSDSLIPRLLQLAYEASFLNEEGRPVRARMFVRYSGEWDLMEAGDPEKARSGDEGATRRIRATAAHALAQSMAASLNLLVDDRRDAVALQEPQHLSRPKQIATLSPTLIAEDSVLLIREQDGDLQVAGISLLNQELDITGPLTPIRPPNATGLLVEIKGPGHLRVKDGRCESTLFANRVVVQQQVTSLDPVRQWLVEVSERLVGQYKKSPDFDPEDLILRCFEETSGPRLPLGHVDLVWTGVLETARQLGHGGTFVVVPSASAAPVSMTYRLQPLDLARVLLNAWTSKPKPPGSAGDGGQALARTLESQHASLLLRSRVRTIGGLSATDGCVVFDRSMVLHGFGGSITAKGRADDGREFTDLGDSSRVSRGELMERFGERHRSAIRLVSEVPNAMAFVLSQDGDLRVMASDDSELYFADALHP